MSRKFRSGPAGTNPPSTANSLDSSILPAYGGWPTFAVLAKVGTHAACVGIFVFCLAPLTDSHAGKCATADLVAPTFTKNVKVGQPRLQLGLG